MNSSFSTSVPSLQIAVDSTSLGEYKLCPRKYKYSIIDGWQPSRTSAHLTFGILLHKAREIYDHEKAKGQGHEESLLTVVGLTLAATWDKKLSRPWASDHNIKNRNTLIRSAIWYLDQFGKDDPLQTVILASGKPAVELSFTLATGVFADASTGEEFFLCGHLDRVVEMNDLNYVADIKTTGHTLDPSFFKSFSPDNQFSLYNHAGRVILEKPIAGMIVDGLQIAVGFTRCGRGLVPRTEGQRTEWLADLGFWLRQMEASAIANHWPMNDKNCNQYGGCQFREICSKDPSSRDFWLEKEFTKRVWDPLQRRGVVE